MPISPIPQGVYPSVTALDPKALRAKGITLVLADLDNTLAPYKVLEPDPEVAAWKEALEREGIQLFILSNSRKPAGPRSTPRPWVSPSRGTRASRKRRATSGPWSAWAGNPGRLSWWGIRSLPIF